MSIPSRGRGISIIRAERSVVSKHVLLPAQIIIHNEALSGLILLIAALTALAWANSPWNGIYRQFQDMMMMVRAGSFAIELDVKHWINDGLMTLFFFVIGLEIKRELVHGELNEWRRASLPVAAAVGGMVLPALIYIGFNIGGDGVWGWGIPMATDIAFAIGVLALLGDRIPSQLRIFLLAVAIVDDIGAILVITVFYTNEIFWVPLGVAAMLLGLIIAMLKGGMRNPLLYIVVALLVWGSIHESGVHATIAGVLLGVVTPATSWFSERAFADSAGHRLRDARHALDQEDHDEVGVAVGQIEELARTTEAPLDRLERTVRPWVSFMVLPLFALVNAGVTFSADMLEKSILSSVTLGVAVGLIVGKMIGITLLSWVAVRLGFAHALKELTWRHKIGVSLLSGIGFTVALFITELAFEGGNLVEEAKVGILAASLFAGLAGYGVLRLVPPPSNSDTETSVQ